MLLKFTRTEITLVTAILVLLSPFSVVWSAKNKNKDIWQTKENLTMRLSAEWHKIGVLKKETTAIADILLALRDLELYPVRLTGFDDDKLVAFDKKIEVLEKRNRQLKEKIDELKMPLTDAIAILREMVVGEPVESMFLTLENGNLRRITEMLNIKHEIDTLWKRTDYFLVSTMEDMGMSIVKKKSEGPIEDEFFNLLKANLGLQSEAYYARLNELKDNFVKMAKNKEIDEMVKIERHRIDQNLTQGNLQLARQQIIEAIDRFKKHIVADDYQLLLAKVAFLNGEYQKVLSILEKIKKTDKNSRLTTLYKMQSLYALHEYKAILADTASHHWDYLHGADNNLILWLMLESARVEKKNSIVERLAGQIEKGAPYSLHVFHAIARMYLEENDDTTALAILEQAKQQKVHTKSDQVALKEINIAIAQLYYERGEYDKAIELFYKLINDSDLFERALFGIAWSYLQSEQYEKAETALRKLINQSPEKSWGAEGILVLIQRHLQKAVLLWKKNNYIMKEKNRLSKIMKRLDELERTDSTTQKRKEIAAARHDVSELLTRIKKEKVADYETISEMYKTINRLCSFIAGHYTTGSFQEVRFSEKREKILAVIDSVLIEIGHEKKNGKMSTVMTNAQQERSKIKKVVDKADVFSVVSTIDRYRWECEYIEWQKNRRNRLLEEQKDTVSFADKDSVMTSISEELRRLPKLDELLVREDSLHIYYGNLLQEKIGQLLTIGLDSTDACYFYYQLGELNYRKENAEYTKKYEAHETLSELYEKALEQFRNGKQDEMPIEPQMPILQHNRSISYYRKAIEVNSASPFCAASHYSLAWCYNDLAEFDSAYEHMNVVAAKYPESFHAAQAWMFCGEYHFDKGCLEDALKAFYRVMKYPESEWFDEALYKVAWTQYRLSNPEKAISSFLALVDLGNGNIGHSLLEKESMDYIAISFSETDLSGKKGLEHAAAFAKKLGDVDRGCQILHRLAQVYRDQGRKDMSKKTYSLILSKYPRYAKNPQVEAELLTVLEKDETTEESIAQKYAYFTKYNRDSKWAKDQPDSIRHFADTTARNILYDAAISYHQLALQKNDTNKYKSALKAYADYIQFYPRASLANECHYNLAEIEFSLGNYRKAAEEYIAVSRRYPDSKYKETAAWNAIVASQNLLKNEASLQR